MTLHVISPASGLGKGDRALNIVVLSEGFLASREGVFLSQVRHFDRVLRASPPFHRFPTLLTVSALFVPSPVSIANITDATRCAWRAPNAAGQVPPDNAPSPFATPFGALYCRARETTVGQPFIPRYMGGSTAKVQAAIAAEPALVALRTAALVLVDNTQAFGGGASDGVGWFSMHGDWVQVAIHELGHSAFGLADEYDNDGPPRFSGTEPSEPNVTTRATRDALRIFWTKFPAKFSLVRWHVFMDAATPAPTSLPNATCVPLASSSSQTAKPGVAANAVGLFEGAHYSACNVFRPRLDCRMRRSSQQAFCPVCEWTIGTKLARTENFMRVNSTATVPGAWTTLASYHEEPSRALPQTELSRLLFYAGGTGAYEIQKSNGIQDPIPPPLTAPGVTIDALWTSLAACEINGLPHFLAHSVTLGRIAIYEVTDDAGKPRLVKRFDSGTNAVPWTHVTTFVRAGAPHMIGYQMATGRVEMSRIDTNSAAPTLLFGTALDANALWAKGYTVITTFTVEGVPHVLKHNAVDGVVHVQSLDPPGPGPHTFISQPGHWSPGATAAIGYETHGRTFVHRMSLGTYEGIDWVWPGGTGVEVQLRRQELDITLAVAEVRGKTSSGFTSFGMHQIAALEVFAGRVRMMIVG
jgi:hypothetical protein